MTEDSPSLRTRRRRARMLRWTALLGILALSTVLGLLHQTGKGTSWWVVSVDALCPFGGVEALWSLIRADTFLSKLALSSVVLLLGAIAVALVMGRAFCGQICPLGTLQEIFGRIGVRLAGRRRSLPAYLDRPARYLKYVVLVVVTLLTWRAGQLLIRPADPWAAYHHLTSPELMSEFAIGAAVLGATLIGSLVYDRFFCKYACPMGALLGLLARFSVFTVRRDTEACVGCRLCDAACPMNLPVSSAEEVRSGECIGCAECVTACPVEGAVALRDRRRHRRLTPLALTVSTLGVFFGLVAVTTVTGRFDWTKPTLASEVQRARETGAPVDTSVIKGWMTLGQVAEATGLDARALGEALGVPPERLDVPLKELEQICGVSPADVRAYVAEHAVQ